MCIGERTGSITALLQVARHVERMGIDAARDPCESTADGNSQIALTFGMCPLRAQPLGPFELRVRRFEFAAHAADCVRMHMLADVEVQCAQLRVAH